MSDTSLIVGLGNPGSAYRDTRHNVGCAIVQAFARERGLNFRLASHLVGELAQGEMEGKKILLLLPATFMNKSGEAVKRCVDYYKVNLGQLLIVCDDVALPLGVMRIRAKGSTGGHNGLKSVETHLRTAHYMRFRIGIDNPQRGDLASYVLSEFTAEEKLVIDSMAKKAVDVLLLFIQKGSAAAMQRANAREMKEEIENQEK